MRGFRTSVAVEFRIIEKELEYLRLLFRIKRITELFVYPLQYEIIGQIGFAPLLIIVSKRHEITQRKFLRTKVSDVGYPDLSDAVFVSRRELLPCLYERR